MGLACVITASPGALLYCRLYPYRRVLPHRHSVLDEVDAPQKAQYDTPNQKIGINVLGKLRVHAWILYRHWSREGPANSPKNRYQEKQQGNIIELGHCGGLSGSTGEIL